jgi:branched-chain amino acid transport system permease protein
VGNFLQQCFNGLVSGAFLALLALGLSVIFGMLGVVNFAHGAFYMLGAFGAYILLTDAGVNFWLALLIVPVVLAVFGMALERLLIHRLARLDPLYNFLLTFGVALVLQDLVKREFGVASQPYPVPAALNRPLDLGLFSYPGYQVFVLAASVLVCVGVWYVLTRSRVGVVVRAATERPDLTRALGINVGRWVTPVFGFGVALAGLAGVLAAPMRAVNPLMGADLIITVFAVVVIGGLGSMRGAFAGALVVGILRAVAISVYPALEMLIIYLIVITVLVFRPRGLFGGAAA